MQIYLTSFVLLLNSDTINHSVEEVHLVSLAFQSQLILQHVPSKNDVI